MPDQYGMITPQEWAAMSEAERQQAMAQIAYQRAQQGEKERQESNKKPSLGQQAAVAMSPAAGYLGVSYLTNTGLFAPSAAAPAAPVMTGANFVGGSGAAGASSGAASTAGAAGAAEGAGAGAAGTGAAGAGSGALSTIGTAMPYVAAALGAYEAQNEMRARHGALKEQGRDSLGGAKQEGRDWWDDTGGAVLKGDWKRALSNWWQFNPWTGASKITQGIVEPMFGSGKKGPQLRRDASRRVLKDFGLVDDKWNLTLDDGSTFDIGTEDTFDERGDRTPFGGKHPYDVDESKLNDPVLRPLIGGANAIAGLTGNQQMSGYLINAATKAKDPYAQMRSWIEKLGGHDQLIQAISAAEHLSGDEKTRLQDGLNQLAGTAGYKKPVWGQPQAKPQGQSRSAKPELRAGGAEVQKKLIQAFSRGRK